MKQDSFIVNMRVGVQAHVQLWEFLNALVSIHSSGCLSMTSTAYTTTRSIKSVAAQAPSGLLKAEHSLQGE